MAERRVDAAEGRARFEKALEVHQQTFERFFLARFLDLEYAYLPEDEPDAEKESCRIVFPITEMVRNPQGSLHGGVIATVMDISMGHLMWKTAGAGATIEMNQKFMRPVLGASATCEGRFLRRGRTLAFMESRLWDEAGKLCVHSTATWKTPTA